MKVGRGSPHRGHGDVSLAQERDWRMIVRKGKVENGNSGLSPRHPLRQVLRGENFGKTMVQIS